jgi:integrase/recombinase XerD
MTISQTFVYQKTRRKHESAPFLEERNAFLTRLSTRGASCKRVRSCSAILLHVIRLLRLQERRLVEREELRDAALVWMSDPLHTVRAGKKSAKFFLHIGLSWLKFSDMLAGSGSHLDLDAWYVQQFELYESTIRGLTSISSGQQGRRIAALLRWNALEQRTLESMTLRDVDAYLQLKRDSGCMPRSIASLCAAFRAFFRFAEVYGFNTAQIAVGIVSPRVARYESEPRGPAWSDVRRMLDERESEEYAPLRSAAIVSLAAIYGLRTVEIVRLKLNDFDWRNEIIVIRRAKSGRVQHFPIQREVGERVIRYLVEARPRCDCRSVFVCSRPPYRQMNITTLWLAISTRMKALGIQSKNFGAHSLRHACATQLLHSGTSLPEIAEFLGHRDLQSVSIYAKHDLFALRDVAAVELEAIL